LELTRLQRIAADGNSPQVCHNTTKLVFRLTERWLALGRPQFQVVLSSTSKLKSSHEIEAQLRACPFHESLKVQGGSVLFSMNNSTAVQNTPAGVFGAQLQIRSKQLLSRVLIWFQRAGDGHIRGAQSVIDGTIVVLSLLTAYLVRFDGGLSRAHFLQFALWAPVLMFGRVLFLRKLGVHRFLWRFVCLSDSIAIAESLMWMTSALLALRWLYPADAPQAYWLRLPLGIIVPEYLLSLCGVLAIRGTCRIAQERSDRAAGDRGRRRKRILLYGAGRAGMMLAREFTSHGGFQILGFVDDDPMKTGTVIAGIRVLGNGNALESLVRRSQVDEVMISIASANPKVLTRIVAQCKAIPVRTRIVPSAEEIIAGRVNISHVREIRIEDLLGRNSVATGEFGPHARSAYEGMRILVTGAGGSIGSELCRQLLLLKPALLAILDKDENSIYDLQNELRVRDPEARVQPLIADIKMRKRVAAVFDDVRPQVVLHAAAHKHVPLMEMHPCEAVLNNVMGLKNVLEASCAWGIERFVFISSDKAVNPTNVMGATKRIGEKLLSVYSSGGSMRAASVRFGNVMGSRGSVIPLFQRQIEAGGPVTVTHPDMVRFFMTIPEAVQLVLCAGSLATRNETFVLEMGNPRRVIDLARQMIELAGLEPDKDIPIVITGLRPGEKMEEELAVPGEFLHGTCFEKVLETAYAPFDETAFERNVEALIATALSGNRESLIVHLGSMELGYQSSSLDSHQAVQEMDLVACTP
jgi:FlaA1/EpsC-like NDP-sugar epimerase